MTYTQMRNTGGLRSLPYRLEYGHWGMTAWHYKDGWPAEKLAEVFFPVSVQGPFDPPEVRDRVFAELDTAARAKLADTLGTTPADLDAALTLARESYYAPGMIILTHWEDLHPERKLAYAVEVLNSR